MKIKRSKVFFVWEHEREEAWLNEMSRNGWQLTSVGFCRYTFEQQEEQYHYRLELLDQMPNGPQSKEYIGFMEDMGVEYVDSLLGWAYFRKKAAEGTFDLYSDTSSKIKHFGRMRSLVLIALILNIFAGLLNLGFTLRGGHSLNGGCVAISFAMVGLLVYAMSKLGEKVRALKSMELINE